MKLLLAVTAVLFAALTCGGSINDPAGEANSLLSAKAVSPQENDFVTCTNAGIDGNVVGLDIVYSAHQPLRAYVIAVYYPHHSGSVTSSDYATDRNLVYPHQDLIQPGAHWHSTVCGLPSYANSTNVKVQSDLLMFADGSSAGPINVRESNHFYGKVEGIAFLNGHSAAKQAVSPVSLTSGEFGTPVSAGNDSLPLRFATVIQQDNGGDAKLVVATTNMASSAVVGYEFKISFFDHATGAFVRSVTTKTLATSNDPSAFLLPGATWSSAPRRLQPSSDGQLETYKVSLDAVALADGTVLGPRKSKEWDELSGMIEGINIGSSLPKDLK